MYLTSSGGQHSYTVVILLQYKILIIQKPVTNKYIKSDCVRACVLCVCGEGAVSRRKGSISTMTDTMSLIESAVVCHWEKKKWWVSDYRPHFQATTCASVYHIWRKVLCSYNAMRGVKAQGLMVIGHGKPIKTSRPASLIRYVGVNRWAKPGGGNQNLLYWPSMCTHWRNLTPVFSWLTMYSQRKTYSWEQRQQSWAEVHINTIMCIQMKPLLLQTWLVHLAKAEFC